MTGNLARMRRVLRHLDDALDDELGLERIGELASSSKYHFHRQFTATFGVTPAAYLRLLRLRRASFQLAFRFQRSIHEIARGSGYASHEAFSRAFKRVSGQSPRDFRRAPRALPLDWLHTLRREHMTQSFRVEDVQIVDFPATRVAALEFQGDPRDYGAALQRFISFRKEHHLPPSMHATYNILYNDPFATPPGEHRIDFCVATELSLTGNAQGLVEKILPGGRAAVVRLVGAEHAIGDALRFLRTTWLRASGEVAREAAPWLQRVRFFPDVPEHEAVVDVFLPLRD